MTEKSKPRAIALPCLFATLTKKYPSHLKLCETKEKQRWRHASGQAVVKRIGLFSRYANNIYFQMYLKKHSFKKKKI